LQLVYIIFVLQPLALGFTKLAFLFFYRRLFVFPGFQMTSLVFIILTAAWIFIFLFGFIFDCGLDFDANWQSLETISRSCPFGFEATIAFTITDACLDLCILLLPLPWVSTTFRCSSTIQLTNGDVDFQTPSATYPKTSVVWCILAWRVCSCCIDCAHGHLHQAKYTF